MIVDTHAHLTDKHLAPEIEHFLGLAADAGVTRVLSIATTLEDSRTNVQLAEKHECLRASVGIHPNNCCQAAPEDWSAIKELASHPQVVALGETGLDRYWDDCPWDTQVDYFRRHLELSAETNLPVVIHTRDCAQETLALLQEVAQQLPLSGVMHSFTGPPEVAAACVELGLYVSFAGMLTFKNGKEVRESAKVVPLDRLLVETDSPYLTPHPHRGKRPNHPALVVHTLHQLAQLFNLPDEEMARHTTDNTNRLFGNW